MAGPDRVVAGVTLPVSRMAGKEAIQHESSSDARPEGREGGDHAA
jgi:hypothetical protein